MRLRFLGKSSLPGDSPTLYATDRDTYVVQGWKVTDSEVLAKLDPPDDETCGEVPAAFVHLCKDGLHGAVANWAPPIAHWSQSGTSVTTAGSVRGHEIITDRAVVADCVRVRDQLWAIAIPHSEYEPV